LREDQVELIDTTFPAGRNDALQWNIRSRMVGKLPVEIRYFTSGITWTADYVGIANEDETQLDLTGYVRVANASGELYDKAQVRLVVGTINLVEKIADLATRPAPGEWKELDAGRRSQIQLHFDQSAQLGQKLANELADMPADAPPEKSKQVVKQGLSEYFLFTIEGREDIEDREPKRLVSMKVADVPLEVIYKLTDRDGGGHFTKFYRFKNVKLLEEDGTEKDLPGMENLGVSPLPDGNVRLFSEYRNKDLAYVDLHEVPGRKERVDENHVKYFLDLNPGEKTFVRYSVTYKRRKVGPELNAEKRREPL